MLIFSHICNLSIYRNTNCTCLSPLDVKGALRITYYAQRSSAQYIKTSVHAKYERAWQSRTQNIHTQI